MARERGTKKRSGKGREGRRKEGEKGRKTKENKNKTERKEKRKERKGKGVWRGGRETDKELVALLQVINPCRSSYFERGLDVAILCHNHCEPFHFPFRVSF